MNMEPRFLETARAVASQAARWAHEADQQRRLHHEVIQALKQSRLLDVLKPARYGGEEGDLLTFLRIAREIARGDASAGWIYAILGIHHWWLALADPRLQDEIWGAGEDVVFADAFPPVGEARPTSGGYLLSGHWKFLSGVEWSEFVAVGAIAPAPDHGRPEYMMFFLPRTLYRIVDEWDVVGLRGTASNSVIVQEAFVPFYRVFPLERIAATGQAPGHQLHSSPLYRAPFVPAICTALVAPIVGATRAAVEEFHKWVETRVPAFRTTPQKEMVSAQMLLAKSTLRVEILEREAERYAEEVMSCADHPVGEGERVRFFAWRALLVREAITIVDDLFHAAGGHAIFSAHPLQRIWRDVHAAAQHVALNFDTAMEGYGRTLTGSPSGIPFL
ncbi:Flavin-dependent monooxygenase, oxygenase subunit HsaA [bacterium HR08]|nr:Flavin-dependent monooxygenase, oxygenase subunit HsaA [bacterium HR08]